MTADLVNAFFYLSIMKEDQKQIVFSGGSIVYFQNLSLSVYLNLSLSVSHNLVQRDFNYLEILQKIIVPERLLLNERRQPGFLAPGGEEFNLGPETRLDHSELLCNKVLLKYKGDRESF